MLMIFRLLGKRKDRKPFLIKKSKVIPKKTLNKTLEIRDPLINRGPW